MLSILLGADVEPEVDAWVGIWEGSGAIGQVRIPLDGGGSFTIQSQSPDALVAMSAAFLTAAGRLRGHIAAKDSAPVTPRPGADALDEAGMETAEGEQSHHPAVAAPPSNFKIDYDWDPDEEPEGYHADARNHPMPEGL
jgi:hypothetical protein